VEAVFAKWDLPCSVIGHVTNDGLLNFHQQGQLQASLLAESLVLGGGAPQYDRSVETPAYFKEIEKFNIQSIADATALRPIAEQLIASPNIASKRWIFNQYDSMVGAANTSTNAPSDAAVVMAKGTNGKAIAMTVDCNSRYVKADPYKGAMIAVAEAARNIVCSGGLPLGVTNCLNFGNPYDPQVYYQFVHAIKGMGEACRKFETPVTGGNVSFYNQNPDGAVNPTPTIGMVGLLDDIAQKMTLDFKQTGDAIYLIGQSKNDIASSEYLHQVLGVDLSPAPYFDLEEEHRVQQQIAQLIAQKLVQSVHDVSDGGLLTALIESGFQQNLGFAVDQSDKAIRKDAFWLGEAQSRAVASVRDEAAFLAYIKANQLTVEKLGVVTSGQVTVAGEDLGSIADWKKLYDEAIEQQIR
jgi:phosphoribosylformylglycinamidine synthase subunit PurL